MCKADNLPSSCAIVTKSGNLNFLEPSGHLQACNGTALPSIGLSFRGLYVEQWPGSSVGVATDYGLDGLGSNPGVDKIFRPSPGAQPGSCRMGAGSFPGVKCGRGVLLTTYPLLVPRSWKSRVIPLPTLWATPGQ